MLLKFEIELPSENLVSLKYEIIFFLSDNANGKILILLSRLLIEIFRLKVLVLEVDGSKEIISIFLNLIAA